MSKAKVKRRKDLSKIEAKPKSLKLRNNFILGGIVLYTLMFFIKCLNHEFTNWDDTSYVVNNHLIRNFSLEGLRHVLSTPIIGMYNPVPFIVYMLQYKIWGLDPKTFHLFNILFHLVATIIVYRFIFRLTNRVETAIIVTILFAIHPMHVSVVAWVSQTKTSLFVIFYFSGLLKYIQYIRSNYQNKYLFYAVLFFILSVASKPSAVSFVLMLFLLDYYLGRQINRRFFIEKFPFFLIALFFGIMTLLTHAKAGDSIFEITMDYSFINLLLVSNYSIVFYIEKLFIPLNLSTLYPYPESAAFLPLKYYLAIPVIPAIALLVYKSGSFRKEMVFGILFFVFAIFVVLRIIPTGFFGYANRYSYLSYIGPFFIIGQFVAYVYDNKFSYAPKIRKYVVPVLCVFIVFCSWRTSKRIQVWENSTTLFSDVIKKHPDLALAYNQKAIASSDYQAAIADLTKAIEKDPKYVDAYSNRSGFRIALQEYDLAMADVTMALKLDSLHPASLNNRGRVELNLGKLGAALIDFNKAIELNPMEGTAYFNRGQLKMTRKDTSGALDDWKKAAELGVEYAEDFINMYPR